MTQKLDPITDWAQDRHSTVFEDEYGQSPPSPRLGSTTLLPPQDQRFRSLSVSLPWRRAPKQHHLEAHESYNRSHQTSEAAVDDSNDGLGAPYASGHTGNRRPSGTIRGIIRRASMSLKGMVHRRPSVATEQTINEKETSVTRPISSHGTWNRFRHAATGFRRSRSVHDFEFLREPDHMGRRKSHSHHVPMPGVGGEPPVIPENSGAAAKASAAMQNEWAARQNLWLHASATSEDGNDRESGIGIVVTNQSTETNAIDDDAALAEDERISRIDFVSKLPTELAIQVLGNLNAAALAKATTVSRHWNKVISNQHIWRESCLRETTSTYATSHPVQPGSGMGVPAVCPDNDWKKVYKAKLELKERWKGGMATPIYLNGHTDSIYCLQFDEFKIVSGSRDKTIRVWDMRTLECKLIIGPPQIVNGPNAFLDDDGNPTHYAAVSDNNRFLVSVPSTVSYDMHHMASILCLQYDDEILVTGSSDSTCIVYDVKAGYRPIRRLQQHTAAVLDLAFDKKHIVTCSKDISICVWDRETGALLRQLRGHDGPVNAVQMRGNTIVSCSGDFRVKLWNIDTGKNIREFVGHTKGLACSQFSEDGRFVASAGNDKVIRIWDANTGECVREMKAHLNLVRSLHIDSVSGRLVSGSYDRDIKVWDMETGHQLLDFPRWHSSWVLSAKSDYRRIVSTGQDAKILILDFGAGVDGIEHMQSDHGRSICMPKCDTSDGRRYGALGL